MISVALSGTPGNLYVNTMSISAVTVIGKSLPARLTVLEVFQVVLDSEAVPQPLRSGRLT
jgi:hypothetical protein